MRYPLKDISFFLERGDNNEKISYTKKGLSSLFLLIALVNRTCGVADLSVFGIIILFFHRL